MLKKLSYEFVKNYFQQRGCELKDCYNNNRTPMSYICSCGNKSKITFSNFKKGQKCKNCLGVETYNIEKVRCLFEINNCILLEKIYKTARTPMSYICSCGNESKITLCHFKQGKRCAICGGTKKLTLEQVRDYFKKNNCELLSTEYINSKNKLKYRCSCGAIDEKYLGNFKKGQRCKNCRKERTSKENHWAWQKDRNNKKEYDDFKKRCYSMVSKCLKTTNQNKINKTYKLLGYTPNQLREHIKNDTSWNDLKNYNWSIDHIFPIKAFSDYGIKNLSIINHLSNLRPLLLLDNISKGDKYNESEFLIWLNKIYAELKIN